MKTGIYPGSFNPPTVAHLAVSEAARVQRGLDQVIWSLSTTALAKEHVQRPLFEHRLEVLEKVALDHDWLTVQVTEHQLLADIADGFDTLIMGADKWDQIQDVSWYGSATERDDALARLPELAVAPRLPLTVPDEHVLELHQDHSLVSSSAARSGALHLMLPAAFRFATNSGAWVDDGRYEQFCSTS